MDYAEKTVDSVVMINKGQKVIDGNLFDVKSFYGTKFITVSYDGNSDFISSLDYVKNVKNYGKKMEIELEDIDQKDLLLRDLVSRITINGFQVTEPSLNNIFIRKVNEGEKKWKSGPS